MIRMDLNGTWRLRRCEFSEPHDFVFSPDFLPEGWLEAPVPGDVRTALRTRGLIDGHYLGKELEKERWIDESDWLYYRRFTLPPTMHAQNAELCLEGVDTLAEIWLNGHRLGKCANMFLPHRFPLAGALIPGENAILIRIRSTVRALAGIDRTGLYPADDTDRLLLRKSQMNFGWDFCGHCLTHGLWKGVSLVCRQEAELGEPYLHTLSLEGQDALLALDADLRLLGDAALAQRLSIRLRLWENETLALEKQWPASQASDARFTLPNVRLWWPRPYGEPFLYQAEIALLEGDHALELRRFRFGARTVELLQPALPQGGRRFVFRVNGRELFIRGANWVPLNAVYAEISPEDEAFFLNRALESNLTMLRIWGGGIYESESFFDFCDAHGLLIMQDFMLACGVLPQTEAFLDQVSQEVAWAVRHYRRRPSLALWSADNELDEAYRWYDMLDQFPANRVNRVAVRRAVEANDPFRPFLVSSPCSPFTDEPGHDDPNSPLQGDMHVYLTRFSKESPYYYKKLLEFVPRFMSEYGFSSLPCRDSYEKFNFFHKPLDMQANPWLGELQAFQRLCDQGDTDGMIYFTQYSHARALQYWIEYMRSYKGTCGGTLYWKFNDPVAPNRENMLFPSLMSVIDFYGMPKLAYDYARRAYADVILAFREEENRVVIYGCNETRQAYAGELSLWWIAAGGSRTLLHHSRAELPPDASVPLADWQPGADQAALAGYLKAEFKGDISLQNRFFPGDIGDYVGVRPPDAGLSCRRLSTDEQGMEVEVHSRRFAQDVCFCVLDRNALYSDNAFDMDPGETRRIRIDLEPSARPGKPVRVSALNAAPQLLAWDRTDDKE